MSDTNDEQETNEDEKDSQTQYGGTDNPDGDDEE